MNTSGVIDTPVSAADEQYLETALAKRGWRIATLFAGVHDPQNLHVKSPGDDNLCHFCAEGDMRAARALLSLPRDATFFSVETLRHVLSKACGDGQLSMVKFLVTVPIAEAVDFGEVDPFKHFFLMTCLHGQLDVAKFLLALPRDGGFDPDVTLGYAPSGIETGWGLRHAAVHRHADIVRLLLGLGGSRYMPEGCILHAEQRTTHPRIKAILRAHRYADGRGETKTVVRRHRAAVARTTRRRATG